MEEKLRSILAQLEFKYQVLKYEKRGVPFRTHLYVPEVHSISGQEYHEWENDAHVLNIVCLYTFSNDHINIPYLACRE